MAMGFVIILFVTNLFLVFVPMVVCQSIGNPPARFLRKKYVNVHGRRMAYVEVGKGDPIVFLHGNPTSSYLWRNIMPHLESHGRLIAPDLIGMGDSQKLPPPDPSRYTVLQHSNFIYGMMEKLGVKRNVTLVLHDWGSAIGFNWAYLKRRDPDALKGIAFMESLVMPIDSKQRPDVLEFKNSFKGPRARDLVLNDNVFVEQTLPDFMIRNLTMKEMDEYRRPFKKPGQGRLPTFTFPNQIPIDGSPRSTHRMVSRYSRWLASSRKVNKLFFRAQPGILIARPEVKFIRSWPNIQEVGIKGKHFVQEDDPHTIGKAIAKWLSNL